MLVRNGTARLVALILGTWIPSAIAPIDVSAQRAPESAEVLARLERGDIRSINIRSAFEMDGNYARYTDGERQQFLDALERIARGGADQSARDAAFTELSLIARSPRTTALQAQEIPSRLIRIYEQTTIRESKWDAIYNLGRVLRTSPRESPQITRLLVLLIKQPVTTRETIEGAQQYQTETVASYQALDALFSACDVAVPVLRQLYAERVAIPDDETRARIEEAADQGFDPARFDLSTGWQGIPGTSLCG
ncbi:MAG: hypothetical protein ACREM1_15555 [Longimicrobiales bacterium]